VFASLASTVDLWSLPIDANRGKVLGELQRLTQDAAIDTSPVLSPDGKRLFFVSSRSGTENIWVKDLVTGGERPLTVTGSGPPILSADGSKVAYAARGVYVIATAGGVAEKVCEACGLPHSWSSDGRNLLTFSTGPFGVQVIDVASGKKTQLLRHPNYDLLSPRFSPDDRWVAFHVRNNPLN
jgi:TolB protein